MIHFYLYQNKKSNITTFLSSDFYSNFFTFIENNLTKKDFVICHIECLTCVKYLNKKILKKCTFLDIENTTPEQLQTQNIRNLFFIDFIIMPFYDIENIIKLKCKETEIFGISYINQRAITRFNDVKKLENLNCNDKEIELILKLQNNYPPIFFDDMIYINKNNKNVKCFSNFNEIIDLLKK